MTSNMSWDAYVENLIAQSKGSDGNTHIDKACIIGLNDGSQWTSATSASLKVQNFVISIFCNCTNLFCADDS